MEINFENRSFEFLQNIVNSIQNKTQSLDYKLPDDMPDAEAVISAWGQCFVKEKQWHGGEIEISGVTNVIILYKSSPDGSVHKIAALAPFQFCWNIDPYDAIGSICAMCHLTDLNITINSLRRMDIQTNVSACVKAYVKKNITLFQPDSVSNDIQLLKEGKVVTVPRESGEKTFAIDEELSVPSSYPQIQEIVNCNIKMEITDKKVITQKAVFRGMAIACITYLSNDGGIYHWDAEMPFSQYTELNCNYNENASIELETALSGVEMTLNNAGMINVKAGIICQYVIFDTDQFETVVDAYCPNHKTEMETESALIPILLSHDQELIRFEQTANIQANIIADISVYLYPIIVPAGNNHNITITGHINILYYDRESNLKFESVSVNKVLNETVDADSSCQYTVVLSGLPKVSSVMSGVNISFDALLTKAFVTNETIDMIKLVTIEEEENKTTKPSFSICKKEDDTLWNIAKRHNSTISAIEAANGNSNEIGSEYFLIIPSV